MNIVLLRILAMGALAFSFSAHALQVHSLSPQGEVAQVRQLVVKFDEAAVNFGDPKAPAPLALSCSDAQVTQGSGRWITERAWAFDFSNDLPPGVRCTVQMKSGFQSASGHLLTGVSSYQFHTGGPFVQELRPGTGGAIDENQYFLARLNGAATTQSVQAHMWCTQEGLGERIPVRQIAGKERDELLKTQGWAKQAAREPLSYLTFACQRRLNASAKVQVIYGEGVATPSGVINSIERRFSYKVREPFMANFTCERENAQAACLPMRPMALVFNAPVPTKLAVSIRLKAFGSSAAVFKPTLDRSEEIASDNVVTAISFTALFPEQTQFTLELPRNFVDAAGRGLGNANNFPLKVATGVMPPLAKFAAAPFGVVERFAERGSPPLLPVTLRNVEKSLAVKSFIPGGKVSDLNLKADADIIAWFRKVQRFDEYSIPRSVAQANSKGVLPEELENEGRDWVQTRMISLLAGQSQAKTVDLPKPQSGDPRPFEVVGIPLQPGFHVLEIASQALGKSLLDGRHGPARTMYVRTSALVTNLGVHFKLGRENAMAWVTTLDKGKPVTNALVQVSSCDGQVLVSGRTNAQGLVYLKGLEPQAPKCSRTDDDEYFSQAYFVSARVAGQDGVTDLAFTWSDWNKGIEPWRFNFPTNRSAQPDGRAHTVLDRSLLRAGQTVSMKHFMRVQTSQGFGLPTQAQQPDTLVVRHEGSGLTSTQALVWRKTRTGGLSADNEFAIAPAAKLGVYQVLLRTSEGRTFETSRFRVEEFRLPVLAGSIAPSDKKPLVAAKSVPTDVQISYVAGGGAAHLPVRVSALVRGKPLSFNGFEEFSFMPPRDPKEDSTHGESDDEETTAVQDVKVVADKLALTLDKNGVGRLTIDKLPAYSQPRDLLLEATYADPNGEVQTLRSNSTLWPAAVVAGIKTEGWVSISQKINFQALALDLNGKPQAGVTLEVRALARIVSTSRKRMVGGFYTYDNKTQTKNLGQVCSGKSDLRGILLCEAKLNEPGEVELVVTAKDSKGNRIQAASSVYVTHQGELWFGGQDHDRMDVLPEKKSYQPGETAHFQVRMPFRFATALVSIEREGILETQVVQLNGKDPTLNLQVKEGWGPNVYVSVLALRGRLNEVPWYSFFTWGYKAPRQWWTSFWYEGREYIAPTALVDLSKPAFRLGVAEIKVGTKAHQLDVRVKADKDSYPVRGKAQVSINVKLPNGKPAAYGEVALAVVDQALLELSPNTSWNVLDAMLQRRDWGVETSTAQMQIVGRRHYGRKAVAPGGGGGHSSTRELLDTLLLWNPKVMLDANGQAQVTIPLNDALTTFQVVAIADASLGLFGTGQTSLRATQDLQIISGLPPLVREDDQFRAQLTLRNTTQKAMRVEVSPRATLLELKPQMVDIPAGQAREVAWQVAAPAQLAQTRVQEILWEITAQDSASGARDALKVSQRIMPAVPLTVQQATLVQMDSPYSLPVAPPVDALPGRGGLKMALQPKLAEGLPGVRDWLKNYPYSCLEQKTSKALGLRDLKLWQTVVAQLPTYLDADGLASYFPLRDGQSNHGSDTLTAYVLAAAHETAGLHTGFSLPDDVRLPMERGLINFVEGRIKRDFWSPRKDLEIRKLAALEALSRYGKAQGRMLQSITVAPNQWPTHAVIDWLNILRRVSDVPAREVRLKEAAQILKSRLSYQGTKLVFSNERDDYWWWLMQSGDTNTARLILGVLDDPAWKDDMGRLAHGFISRQQRGAWSTTTANLWGGLALEKFSNKFEATPVTGVTKAALGSAMTSVDWSRVERVKVLDSNGAVPGNLRNNTMFLPWPQEAGKNSLSVSHQGAGKPWLTLQSVAAIALKAPFNAGYQITKTITPVEQAVKGKYSRGDVLRITLEINASADMTWVVVSDPVAGGASILGSGLGRDSEIATQGEQRSGDAWAAFEERSFEAFRSYYDYLPKGKIKLEYTVRLNNVGDFALPPTRVEAMYAPEMFGEFPNGRLKVEAAP